MSTHLAPLARLPFARFLGAGATGVLVNLAVYAMCLASNTPVALAVVIAFVAAAANNYYWYQRTVFDVDGSLGRSMMVAALACAVNTGIVVCLVTGAGAPAIIAQMIGIVLVAPGNFQLHQRWVFA